MPETNHIFFSHKELLELLLKKADVHDGKWMLAANFGFAAGNYGPTQDQISPAAIVTILKLGIVRATDDVPESAVLDAALVNPADQN